MEERPTLHDIAAWVVQIEPADSADWERVGKALHAFAESSPPLVQSPLRKAIRIIGRIAEGKASDPSSLLAGIGSFIEQAINAMETPAEGDGPSPGAEPDRLRDENPAAETERPDSPTLDADPVLLREFITESRELVAGAEAALLELEIDPEDTEAINTVFRAFHTVKGTSAFLGLDHLSRLAHGAESFFSRIRDKEIRCCGGYADLAFRSVDMLKDLLRTVETGLSGESLVPPEGVDELMSLLAAPEEEGISDEAGEVPETRLRLGDILVAQGKAAREEIEAAATGQGDQPIGLAIVRSGAASLTDVGRALRKQRRLTTAGPTLESSVRVRTDRLDRLIEMVGELVIGHSMVAQDDTVSSGSHHELQRKVNHTGKIVRDLQGLCMSMRMVPLKATFQKMARMARDLARKQGALINFVAVGEETEIDRNMVDLINDPLVHLVRNAVDHGIESPDEREENGKPRAGTLALKGYHSGGSVVVEIMDDGRGLDRDKIIRKAIAKKLIPSGKGMSDGEITHLIFLPGFSTADQITDLSGRGVGLDVVSKAVEALRGRVDVASEPGKGCTFSIRLPLTMAVTDGMLVRVGHERYILPMANIHMSLRPDTDALFTVAGQGEAVIFQGSVLPVLRLHRLFGIEGAVEDPTRGLLIIVGEGDQRCALMVDELLGQHQVVARSLGEGIGKVMGVSGGAILGDGRVGVILDPHGITALARQTPDLGIA